MNRVWIALAFGLFGAAGGSVTGCAPSTVGDPCTPEKEFSPGFAGASAEQLTLDLNSVQCDTRVCMSHYFQGRVSCPYGNSPNRTAPNSVKGYSASGPCYQVAGYRGLYTTTGDFPSAASDPVNQLCCPIIGRSPTAATDTEPQRIGDAVPAQCSDRTAKDSVYCTCRCDVPDTDKDGKPVDRSLYSLCKCPDGFTCSPVCNGSKGGCGVLPFGKWGSYCVKSDQVEVDQTNAKTKCSSIPLALPPKQ
jgi:hypothetical protein